MRPVLTYLLISLCVISCQNPEKAEQADLSDCPFSRCEEHQINCRLSVLHNLVGEMLDDWIVENVSLFADSKTIVEAVACHGVTYYSELFQEFLEEDFISETICSVDAQFKHQSEVSEFITHSPNCTYCEKMFDYGSSMSERANFSGQSLRCFVGESNLEEYKVRLSYVFAYTQEMSVEITIVVDLPESCG